MPKCKICKSKFERKRAIQPVCNNYDCMVAYAKKVAEKATQKKIKQEKQERKALKEKLKVNTTNWKNKLQTKVQEIARLIDKGLTCIARGNSNQIHGGHVFPKKGNECMRFNLHGIHRQGAHSNHFQNDDAVMREGVAREYGEKYLEFIKSLTKQPVPKLNNLEYKEKYEIACEISNRLRKLDKEYSLQERIELRNQINLELGIYTKEQCIFLTNKN